MSEQDRKDLLLLERVQFILSIALRDIEKTGNIKRFGFVVPLVIEDIKSTSEKLRIVSQAIIQEQAA